MIAEGFVYAIAVTLLIGLAALSVEHVLAEIGRPRRYAWLGAYGASLTFPPLSLLLAAGTPAAETVGAPSTVAATALPAFDWNALLDSGLGGRHDSPAARVSRGLDSSHDARETLAARRER